MGGSASHTQDSAAAGRRLLPRARFDDLLAALAARGYTTIGPTVRDGAIVYDEVAEAGDLPAGLTDEQDGGTYRLARRDDDALFGYALGPQSFKRILHPPHVTVWRATRDGADVRFAAPDDGPPPRYALLGVRSCELHAIAHLDDALLHVDHPDAGYAARRAEIFTVAVQCGQAGGTCFCVSMQTGPRAERGFDLALTELLDGEHRFVAEAGTEAGAGLLAELDLPPAGGDDTGAALAVSERAAAQMGRALETDGLRELLAEHPEHPRWDEVADRCLACGNCTMVCPTCFCTTFETTTDLAGGAAEHARSWDSCFTMDFTYIHGGSVRASHRSRYRQWMTHKLSTWVDQFGTSGCVGCGRCITWCPVAIDITEEAAAIRAEAMQP